MEVSPEFVARFRRDLEALAGAPPGPIGIAVSGGPDSLALLLLAQAAYPGTAQAATLDHGLRPESAEEAAFVAAVCQGLGVPHAVLHPAEPITGNLQSAARRERYAALEQWRGARRLDWVLTAHHADDQAETLLMRLNRGSGVGGLSGIRPVYGRVARPLLGWAREELAQIVRDAGIEAVADPGNADERFDRVRIRGRLAETGWIDRAGLVRSAEALAEADEALEWTTDRLLAERARGDEGESLFDPAEIPAELRRRLVLRALRRIVPAANPRGDELSRLMATLEVGGIANLAGVKCSGGSVWRFEPEPPRRSG
jgi:tRNA(Ile)-lysidine synthase